MRSMLGYYTVSCLQGLEKTCLHGGLPLLIFVVGKDLAVLPWALKLRWIYGREIELFMSIINNDPYDGYTSSVSFKSNADKCMVLGS